MIRHVIESHENNISPDRMQLVFKWPGLPALDEPLDGFIVILISWLEAKGIMKDEPFIDR